jgi:hypothetical protein
MAFAAKVASTSKNYQNNPIDRAIFIHKLFANFQDFTKEKQLMRSIKLSLLALGLYLSLSSVADACIFGRARGCGKAADCCAPAPACCESAPAPTCCAPAPAPVQTCCAPAPAPVCCAPAPAPVCCAPAPAPTCCAPAAPACCEPACDPCKKSRKGLFSKHRSRKAARSADCCSCDCCN